MANIKVEVFAWRESADDAEATRLLVNNLSLTRPCRIEN